MRGGLFPVSVHVVAQNRFKQVREGSVFCDEQEFDFSMKILWDVGVDLDCGSSERPAHPRR